MTRRLNGPDFWLLVIAALASLAITQPVFAQSSNGRMQGVVSDAKGQPVDGATVTMELADGSRKFETKTTKTGDYTQVGLPSGTYKVTVQKDALGVAQVVNIRQGAPLKTNFKLAPGAATATNAELTKAYSEGVEAEKAGNHDEAIAKFTHATEVGPTCADCYAGIGASEAAKKDYDKAEAAYKKAIEIKPDLADAYNGLASIYNAQRKFDLAAEAGAKAAEISSAGAGTAGGGNAEAMFNQGVILWNAGKIPEAKKQFQAVIAANPNHAEAHYQLAMALVNEGDLKGAGAEFDTYLRLAPNGPNAATAKSLSAQLPK